MFEMMASVSVSNSDQNVRAKAGRLGEHDEKSQQNSLDHF
jgi:hypothetical protein